MSYKKYLKGKVAYVENKNLPSLGNVKGGHYVYVRSYNPNNNKCDVNTFTSLEDKNHLIKNQRMLEVRKGNIYPIPKSDTNMALWSGVSCNPIYGVKASSMKLVDKKKIKKRHRFFINKYLGNKRYK